MEHVIELQRCRSTWIVEGALEREYLCASRVSLLTTFNHEMPKYQDQRRVDPARSRSPRDRRRPASPPRSPHRRPRSRGRDEGRSHRTRDLESRKSHHQPSRSRSRSRDRKPYRRREDNERGPSRARSPPTRELTNRQPVGELHRVPDDIRSENPPPRSPTPPTADLPNFAPSGKLAAETKTVNGVVLKYHEPSEARKPTKHWRLHVFKGEEQIEVLHVHRQSAYLFGRERAVVDVPIEHPSSSKQHAVLQYRQVQSRDEFGQTKSAVKWVFLVCQRLTLVGW